MQRNEVIMMKSNNNVDILLEFELEISGYYSLYL